MKSDAEFNEECLVGSVVMSVSLKCEPSSEPLHFSDRNFWCLVGRVVMASQAVAALGSGLALLANAEFNEE